MTKVPQEDKHFTSTKHQHQQQQQTLAAQFHVQSPPLKSTNDNDNLRLSEDDIGFSYTDRVDTSSRTFFPRWSPPSLRQPRHSDSRPHHRLGPITIILVLLLGTLFLAFKENQQRSTTPTTPHPHKSNPATTIQGFTISDTALPLPAHLAASLSLTEGQCDVAFPLLWPQVEARRREQLDEGRVTEDMLYKMGGGARVTWIDGDMFIKRYDPSGTRTLAVLASMRDALISAPEPVPNFDMFFQPIDIGYPGAVWETVQPRPGKPGWLVPDFGFYSWPEPILTGYKGVVREVERVENEVKWEDKIPKLFWRGVFLCPVRDSLRRVTDGKPWADIAEIVWSEKGKGSLPLWDHCRYKYLVHTEGYLGAYSGRLKFLANCKSVIITHRLTWDQHFHPALDYDPKSPNQNIIMLEGTNDEDAWDELEKTINFLEKNPRRAEKIADNAWRTLHGRYLTPASVACYWRKALKAYSETLAFVPSIGGKDYESFQLMGRTEWEPTR
ncbi:hypothetical protein T439DRAFT_325249 [Meredithblackwellia eburnea MCA 4105]